MNEKMHYIVSAPCRVIKSIAKELMKGNWAKAILAVFIGMLITTGPSIILSELFKDSGFIDSLLYIYGFFAQGAVAVGLASFFLKIARKENPEIKDMFPDVLVVLKACVMAMLYEMLVLIFSLLFIIPGIIALYRYRLCFIVMAEHPEMTPIACLRESRRITMGNKMKLFSLDLSFLGWIFISAIPGGVYYFWFIANNLMDAVLNYDIMSFEEMNLLITDTILNSNFALILQLTTFAFVFVSAFMKAAEVSFYEMANGNIVLADTMKNSEEM